MGEVGFEPIANPSGNTLVPDSGGNKSGNTNARRDDSEGATKPTDPDLAAVVAAWSDLPHAMRAGIVAMVKAGSTSQ